MTLYAKIFISFDYRYVIKDQPNVEEVQADGSIWNNDIEEAILGFPKTCDMVQSTQVVKNLQNTPRKDSGSKSGSSENSQTKGNKQTKKKQPKGGFIKVLMHIAVPQEPSNDINFEEKKIDLNFKFTSKGGPPKFVNAKIKTSGK
jgi:hypothetical protein